MSSRTTHRVIQYLLLESKMVKQYKTLFPLFLWLIWLSTVSAGNNNTDYFQSVRIHDNALMFCPIFKEVLEKDGAFETVYWSNCTSSCDYQNLRWAWLAGVNRTGASKVGRKDVNITKDGAVEIQNVQLSDAGKYRCTVKRINHTSPQVHFITLSVNINDSTNSTLKPTASSGKTAPTPPTSEDNPRFPLKPTTYSSTTDAKPPTSNEERRHMGWNTIWVGIPVGIFIGITFSLVVWRVHVYYRQRRNSLPLPPRVNNRSICVQNSTFIDRIDDNIECNGTGIKVSTV